MKKDDVITMPPGTQPLLDTKPLYTFFRQVLKEDDTGWWQGEVDGRIGWFPFNYVEIVE